MQDNSSAFSRPVVLDRTSRYRISLSVLKRQRQVWAYLRGKGIALGPEVLPGPNVTSDAAILDFIRGHVTLLWHASATCKMGKADDPIAVVDSRTRVFGVRNLRVVDASAFPFLPPGHLRSTVYALAEKVADEILKGLNSPGRRETFCTGAGHHQILPTLETLAREISTSCKSYHLTGAGFSLFKHRLLPLSLRTCHYGLSLWQVIMHVADV